MFNNFLIGYNQFKLVKESFTFCWLYLEISRMTFSVGGFNKCQNKA